MIKKIYFIILLVLLIGGPVLSQTSQSLVGEMIKAFQQNDYETAEKIGKRITADYESFTPSELLEAHKILGVIAFQFQNRQEANAQFELALSIDRTAQLDSFYVSPKIIEYFNELKSTYNSRPKSITPNKEINYRYLIDPDPRPAATLRSMVLPGWGQLYKNDKRKGAALLTATAATTITMGVFHFLQLDAHDKYLHAAAPDKIDDAYQRYNTFYKLRNNAALINGGIWLYAFFDALITKPKAGQTRLNISFKTNDDSSSYLVAFWLSF